MALDIRSPSAGTSSTPSSPSSSTKSRGNDLFAQDMATAARSAQKSAAVKQARHTAAPPKPASTSKPASSPKPKSAADSADSSSKTATGQRTETAKPKTPTAAQPTAQQTPAPEDAAAAPAEASAAGTTSANAAKGRAPNRTASKSSAPQTAAAANEAGDAIDDPGADSANQSGLSLLQLLAQSFEGDAADGTPTDTAAPAATDQPGAKGTDKTSDDPSAIALAMFTQALAAALARQATPNSNAAAGDATAGIAAATQSPGGAASMQDLMSVLAHDVAATAQGKSDDGTAQFNVAPTKDSATDAGSTDATAVGPNSLAHLGVASHFSAPHLRNDTNKGELQAAVGSSAWDEELGTHLSWMTQKGLETGSLRISPEHLGPVEVNISVHNGDASVWFAAHHPDTRAALEQALPKLREMFANQGMNLADSGVSRQSLSQNGSRNQGRSTASQGISGVSAVGGADGSASAAVRMSLGLVDTYA